MSPFDTEGLERERRKILTKMEEPGFWDDHEKAQGIMREKKVLDNKLEAFSDLNERFEELEVLIELAEEEYSEQLEEEVVKAYNKFQKDAEDLRIKTLFVGEYDIGNAIISLHSGSGGLDSQDWAEMLFRMYIRWAENKGYNVKIWDLQDDTEAGIKSATILIEGDYAFGYLKNEKGVHRIVRISPFDSSGRRHTSFASLDVLPETDDTIEIEINPEDLRIDTFRSGGAGGQHVNKTDSAVRITHIPTNIVVSCQNERSQHQNKDVAMRILRAKLFELAKEEQKSKIDELKGDYSQITWGSQIRSYVFHPYTMVKDHRTNAEVGNVAAVLDGDLDYFMNEMLKKKD